DSICPRLRSGRRGRAPQCRRGRRSFADLVRPGAILKGTLHEAAAGYAPKDPFFQNAFHTRAGGGSVGWPEYKRPRFAGPLQSPLTDSNRRPLLTMERLAQLVTAGGNRFGLFLRVLDPVDLPL